MKSRTSTVSSTCVRSPAVAAPRALKAPPPTPPLTVNAVRRPGAVVSGVTVISTSVSSSAYVGVVDWSTNRTDARSSLNVATSIVGTSPGAADGDAATGGAALTAGSAVQFGTA